MKKILTLLTSSTFAFSIISCEEVKEQVNTAKDKALEAKDKVEQTAEDLKEQGDQIVEKAGFKKDEPKAEE